MKTQYLAMVASYQAFLSEEQEEVYIAGWNRDQSNLCYNEIMAQISKVDMLKDLWREAYHFITVFKNNSTIKALSREARRSGDGTNPSLGIIDEYGTAHETNEIVDVIDSGMTARKEPLLIYITTAGFHLDYPCYNYYHYCSDILNPDMDTENDDIFIAIYELDPEDDVKDESLWVKANPIVTTYEEGLKGLRSGLQKALDRPEDMRNFLTKNMNMWVDMKDDGYMSLAKWNEQEMESVEIEEFLEGASLYYGIDLSTTTDLTSLGWVAVKDGKFLVGQRSYMPSDKFRERMSRDKIRFDVFEERGELVLTRGSVVDYNYLIADLKNWAKTYGVKQVGFDQWNATHLATELLDDGLEMVEVPQSITRLSEPTKKFRESVYNKSLYHTGDQLLRWSMSNAITQVDANENVRLSKQRSKDRIDPVASIINAYSLAMFDDQIVDLNEVIMADDWSF